MTSQLYVLLTGATGFVGGTIVSQLTHSTDTTLRSLSITALVRSEEQAQVLKNVGIRSAVLEGGLDDAEGLTRLARQHDAVLHMATGFHPPSAEALIRGLAMRKKDTGADPIYFQLSGTTNLSVGDVSGHGGPCLLFSDKDEGIYDYEVEREALRAYEQRTTDIKVVEASEAASIRAYIIMPPPVYGRGSGHFKKSSQQIPLLIENALKAGRAEYIAPGTSSLGHVHVADLARLIEVVLVRAIQDPQLPYGRDGYFFAATGRHRWMDVANSIASIGHELGVFESPEATPIPLSSAAVKFWEGDEAHTERILASSSNTRAERGYELGWRPESSEEHWESCIREDIYAFLRERQGKI